MLAPLCLLPDSIPEPTIDEERGEDKAREDLRSSAVGPWLWAEPGLFLTCKSRGLVLCVGSIIGAREGEAGALSAWSWDDARFVADSWRLIRERGWESVRDGRMAETGVIGTVARFVLGRGNKFDDDSGVVAVCRCCPVAGPREVAGEGVGVTLGAPDPTGLRDVRLPEGRKAVAVAIGGVDGRGRCVGWDVMRCLVVLGSEGAAGAAGLLT